MKTLSNRTLANRTMTAALALTGALVAGSAFAQTTIIQERAPGSVVEERRIITREAPDTVIRREIVEEPTTGSIDDYDLTPEQDIVVRRTIVQEEVPPVEVRGSVTIGSIVPPDVELRRFSSSVYGDAPRLRSVAYFRSPDDKIVLVEPRTRRVVRIIDQR